MEKKSGRRVLFADLKDFCCQACMHAGVPAAEAGMVACFLLE